jgi:hypothetical protein
LSFGDEDGDVGVTQVVGGAGPAYRDLDGWVPVAAAEAVVIEWSAVVVGEDEVGSGGEGGEVAG